MSDIAAELKALEAASMVSSHVVTPMKARVRSLDVDSAAALVALQAEYDDFVGNSEMLEEELERELAETGVALSKATIANEDLKSQLEARNGQVVSLENELASTTSKLTNECTLRVSAELAEDEAERRARNSEGALDVATRDCEMLHEKLAYAESESEEFLMNVEIEREEHEIKMEELERELAAALARAVAAERKLLAAHNTTNNTAILKRKLLEREEAASVVSVTESDRMTDYSEDQLAEADSFDDDPIETPDHLSVDELKKIKERKKRKRGFASSVVRKLGKRNFKGQKWFRSKVKAPVVDNKLTPLNSSLSEY